MFLHEHRMVVDVLQLEPVIHSADSERGYRHLNDLKVNTGVRSKEGRKYFI